MLPGLTVWIKPGKIFLGIQVKLWWMVCIVQQWVQTCKFNCEFLSPTYVIIQASMTNRFLLTPFHEKCHPAWRDDNSLKCLLPCKPCFKADHHVFLRILLDWRSIQVGPWVQESIVKYLIKLLWKDVFTNEHYNIYLGWPWVWWRILSINNHQLYACFI